MNNYAGLLLAAVFLIFINNKIKAQTNESSENDDPIFSMVDTPASYPNGQRALHKYIIEELKYPENAKKDGASGTVFVEFVIEKDGSLSNFSIMRGATQAMNEEAIRVLKKSINWEPAINNEQTVRSKQTLPIRFVSKKD